MSEAVFNLVQDFEAFRENVIKRLDLLEESLPPEAKREAWILRATFEINEFRAGRGV